MPSEYDGLELLPLTTTTALMVSQPSLGAVLNVFSPASVSL